MNLQTINISTDWELRQTPGQKSFSILHTTCGGISIWIIDELENLKCLHCRKLLTYKEEKLMVDFIKVFIIAGIPINI